MLTISRIQRDERGSLVIAMLVMMVLTTLSLAALARTIGWLGQIRNAQDYDAALGAADAGLSDALFAIDQAATGDHHSTGAVDHGSFEYWAVKIDESQYRVEAKGTVGDSSHGVRARITRSARFPHALFSVQDLVFDGNANWGLGVYNNPGALPAVGSNGKIVVNSNKLAPSTQHYYGASAGCSGCPNPVKHDAPNPVEEVDPPTTVGMYQECPADGVFTGFVDGKNGLPFVCDKNVKIVGTLSVINPPLIIYVTGAHSLDLSDTALRANSGNSAINLQLYVDGGKILMPSGDTSGNIGFSGILYAPKSDVVVNGGLHWTGAMVVNSISVNGAPNFLLEYDANLATYLGKDWSVSRYAEIPSAEADGVGLTSP